MAKNKNMKFTAEEKQELIPLIEKEQRRRQAVKLGQQRDTLWGKFIKKKIAEYVKPIRKGTRKGDPIGFSQVKYEYSLYCLHSLKDLNFKLVSMALGVPYAVLANWRSQEQFKKQVEAHEKEWTEIFINFMRSLRKVRTNRIKDEVDIMGSLHAYTKSLKIRIVVALQNEYEYSLPSSIKNRDMSYPGFLIAMIPKLFSPTDLLNPTIKELVGNAESNGLVLRLKIIKAMVTPFLPPGKFSKAILEELTDMQDSIRNLDRSGER